VNVYLHNSQPAVYTNDRIYLGMVCGYGVWSG